MKEIPLHQEMVSVTGSVTWISHSPSVIGMGTEKGDKRDGTVKMETEAERNCEMRREGPESVFKRMSLTSCKNGVGADLPICRQVRK